MIQRIIVDLVGGAWTILGLLFAVVCLPSGPTQETMAILFGGLTVIWLVTGPLRWRDE
jgi:hypothetical protein